MTKSSHIALTAAAILTMAANLYSEELPGAQEKPLGDVAREARAQKSDSPRASKVVTNEEASPGRQTQPIANAENPVDVVNRARVALYLDPAHTCVRQAAGNSGPGWRESRITQVSYGDRMHMTVDSTNPVQGSGEWIVIGRDLYRKAGAGPWEKIQPGHEALTNALKAAQIPDVLMFRYNNGDMKFMREEPIEGSPTFLYEYSLTAGDMRRTIRIWVGKQDHLPRRAEMHTITTSWGSAPVIWDVTDMCSFGAVTKIESPI
jgi:hypothetical protein